MYGNLTIEHFKAILNRIKDNHKSSDWVTHKKIRIYLECMSDLWHHLSFPDTAKYLLPEIEFLFRAMECRISHEKRAFLADRLLELLSRIPPTQQQEESEYNPDIF